MTFKDMIDLIYNVTVQYIPLFRIIWVGSIVLGIALFCMAFFTKRKTELKRLPWILGIGGSLLTLSASAQLITSLMI